jgi:hypothetical protein
VCASSLSTAVGIVSKRKGYKKPAT